MTIAPSIEMLSILGGSVALSAGGTWLVLHKFRGFGLDLPDERRKTHERAIPRVGGLPIFITLMTGFALAAWRVPGAWQHWWPVMLTCTIIFAIGFADDLRPLGARVKLLGQLGAACTLYALDVSIDDLSNPFGPGHLLLGWWSFPVTVFWLVAIPNLINLIDGMDGLATGFGLFLALTLAFVGHFNLKPDVVVIAVVMSGALAGFLIFNFPPARIFLGDGGAYLIGFFIASASLVSSEKGSVMGALLVIFVALGVPILDTLFAILRRGLRGVPIFRADAEHIHHRLVLMGFSKTRALIALYSVSLVLSLLAISLLVRRGLAIPIAAAALFLLALFAVRYLGYVKSWVQLRQQLDEALRRRRDMLFTGVCGRMAEWEAERCDSADDFVRELRHSLTRAGLSTARGPGLRALPLRLISGAQCRLYHHDTDPTARERWLAKADLFLPAIDFATERWGLLPELDIETPPTGSDPRAGSSSHAA